MVDFLLLNGNKKCTLIERFDGSAVVLAGVKTEFSDLEQAKHYIKDKDLEINISYLFGSSVKRGTK